jgi:hypothetical protein
MRYDGDKFKNDFEKSKIDYYSDDYGERERGGCLTVFLVLLMAANSFAVFGLCAQSDLARYPGGEFALLLALEIAVVVCAAALWNWKKWGYYGLMLGYVLGIVLGLAAGSLAYAGGSIIGMVILAGLVNDKLDMFD